MDDSLFREFLRPDEMLIWSAKPVLLPLSPKAMLGLLAVAAFGCFGAIQTLLMGLGLFAVGPGMLRITHSPVVDFLTVITCVLVASVVLISTFSNRRRTRTTTFGCSRTRLFTVVSGTDAGCGHRNEATEGRITVEREGGLVNVALEIRGQPEEEEYPRMRYLYGLTREDADQLLVIFNIGEEHSAEK
ncbi:MAG: hypothetical protein HZT43_14500 [Exiguobacterium profundum]|nr:MAG: hypothetical protein HZT43_14500 [Exiguobacterium profundum]